MLEAGFEGHQAQIIPAKCGNLSITLNLNLAAVSGTNSFKGACSFCRLQDSDLSQWVCSAHYGVAKAARLVDRAWVISGT